MSEWGTSESWLAATYELVLSAPDVGDLHVVGGRGEILKLLAGEDVDGDKVDLGVTVLAGLGGGHFDDLAGTLLDDDVAVLPQGRALHGEGERGTGIGALEGVLMLQARVSRRCRGESNVECAASGATIIDKRWGRRGKKSWVMARTWASSAIVSVGKLVVRRGLRKRKKRAERSGR